MRAHIAVTLVLLVGGTIGAHCQPPTPAPPTPDAGPVGDAPPGPTACLVACTSMQQAGCREGADPFCPVTMGRIESEHRIVPSLCPDGGRCTVTCAWCATVANGAEVVAKCGSSCSP